MLNFFCFVLFKDSVDSQERRVHQASKGNLEDQDPRVTLDTQEYLDFQVTPKFKKIVPCNSSKAIGNWKMQLSRHLCGGG